MQFEWPYLSFAFGERPIELLNPAIESLSQTRGKELGQSVNIPIVVMKVWQFFNSRFFYNDGYVVPIRSYGSITAIKAGKNELIEQQPCVP